MTNKSLKFTIQETHEVKQLISPEYNYAYNKYSDVMLRWGANKDVTPLYSPFGPEIAFVDTEGMNMELFTLIAHVLSSTKTLAAIGLGDIETIEQYIAIQDICDKAGVSHFISMPKNDSTYEGSLFSLYVSPEGIIKPYANYYIQEGINILDVKNLTTDVWYSDLFKKARWESFQPDYDPYKFKGEIKWE